MKAALLLHTILLAAAFWPTSKASAELPFQPGDRFAYSLHWSLIKVGEAVLEFDQAPLEPGGEDYLYVLLTVETSGIADKLFKVRDKIESWVDMDTGRPVFYKKKQREGKTKETLSFTLIGTKWWHPTSGMERNVTQSSSMKEPMTHSL